MLHNLGEQWETVYGLSKTLTLHVDILASLFLGMACMYIKMYYIMYYIHVL